MDAMELLGVFDGMIRDRDRALAEYDDACALPADLGSSCKIGMRWGAASAYHWSAIRLWDAAPALRGLRARPDELFLVTRGDPSLA